MQGYPDFTTNKYGVDDENVFFRLDFRIDFCGWVLAWRGQ